MRTINRLLGDNSLQFIYSYELSQYFHFSSIPPNIENHFFTNVYYDNEEKAIL